MLGRPETYTISEVAKHGTAEDGWIAVHGKVYDITAFIQAHPGTFRRVHPIPTPHSHTFNSPTYMQIGKCGRTLQSSHPN